MRQGKAQVFPVYNDDSLTSMNRQSSSIAAASYAMITKRHKLKLIIYNIFSLIKQMYQRVNISKEQIQSNQSKEEKKNKKHKEGKNKQS